MQRLSLVVVVLILVGLSQTPAKAQDLSKYLLGGTAQNSQDPENPLNDVIKIDTGPGPIGYGTVSKRLNAKVNQLDNMLEFKSYFQNRSCGGGSPRIQLAIDLDGDGVTDGNAFGYTAPPFAGCPANRWQYDDLTDEMPRWDVSQLVAGGFPSPATICTNPLFSSNPLVCPLQTHSGYITWPAFETVMTTLFPMHRVCSGALVDDSSWFPAAAGVAYYDIITMFRVTWEDRGDTAGRGFARGCNRPDCGDDEHDGDEDHDHERTAGDNGWRDRHRGDN